MERNTTEAVDPKKTSELQNRLEQTANRLEDLACRATARLDRMRLSVESMVGPSKAEASPGVALVERPERGTRPSQIERIEQLVAVISRTYAQECAILERIV